MPSTVIRSFDYHPASAALDIEFTSGRRYRYSAVPAEVAEAFRAAFSRGRFFNERIRDAFACRALAPEIEDWGGEWA